MKYSIVPVLEFYGATVPFREGRHRLCCPFHDDRTPSASVDRAKNTFHCFACGIHEDAVGLIRLQEGGSYEDAKRKAEAITGERDDHVREEPPSSDFLPGVSGGHPSYGRKVASWRSRVA